MLHGLSSIKTGGTSRTLHGNKRGERLIHIRTVFALARCLVDVLRTLLRDSRPFTPTAPQPINTAA
ncbi:hypothetical protein [Haloechinothrix aidingensis]|uniref:hypothetical protein n=1 Tax=Haloechinothrix aidingensis TaxID=2752311 RepID=UPI0015DE652B|nr:hypothetical protein [Haloechinothrix aidingensis]